MFVLYCVDIFWAAEWGMIYTWRAKHPLNGRTSPFEVLSSSSEATCSDAGDGLMWQVTDLTLARENQTNFEEYLQENTTSNPGIDLTVTVLTTGFWPSYKSSDLALPAEMVSCKHSNSIHYVAYLSTF